MVQINWSLQAKEDLKDIAYYISKDSKRYAKRQVKKIKDHVKILNPHLRAGKMTPEFENPKVRELVEGNYRIIYYIANENRVDILTVHHGARDLYRRNIEGIF